MTTDARAKFEALPRKLLDVACRIRAGETLFRDDELVDEAAHALKAALASAQSASAEPAEPYGWILDHGSSAGAFMRGANCPSGWTGLPNLKPLYTTPATAAVTDEQIIARCAAAGVKWIPPDDSEDGFPGSFDMASMDEMRAALATRTPEPQAAFCDPTDPGHDVNVLREHVRHLERRVRQLSEPQPDSRGQAREGWRWVPVEATTLMLEAAMRRCGDIGAGCFGMHKGADWDDFREAWAAMIAASPAPEPREAQDSIYPECSGEPASCPENEGFGCCKNATVATDAQWCSCVPTRCEGVGRCRWHAMGYVPKALRAAQDEQRAQAAQEGVDALSPEGIRQGKFTIEVEKMLCDILDRPWSPRVSIESLCVELRAALAVRQQP